jgi:hypothetical protein
MKELFVPKEFRTEALERIKSINSVIRSFQDQNLKLTLRQLYYNLVATNEIPNKASAYDSLGSLLSDARLAGLVDWDAIEDRGRAPFTPDHWDDLSDFSTDVLRSFRLNRWQGQRFYLEVWVEKQTLAGIVQPITNEYHVTFLANRGYSSQSTMYDSAKRFIAACAGVEDIQCQTCSGSGACGNCDGDGLDPDTQDGTCSRCVEGKCIVCSGSSKVRDVVKEPRILYIGDHDPSGEDMVRDIRDRMTMFGVSGIRVLKIALTKPQIERYDPPPNPAKLTDSRARAYIDKHGDDSWEVEALPPAELNKIIRYALDKHVDRSKMDLIVSVEQAEKRRMEAFAKSLRR